MKRAIRSEMLKLLTVRSTFGVLLGAIAISVVAFVAPGENIVRELAKPLSEQQSVFLIGFLMRVLLLVLGIRVITDEWRHGTITPSLLVLPGRGKFVTAKALAVAATGAMMAAVAAGAMVATAASVAAVHESRLSLGSTDIPVFLGLVIGGGLWAVIGVGFGTIVKSQLVATVTGMVWLMSVEDMLRDRLGDLAPYLPGQAGIGLAVAPSAEVMWRTAETVAAYAVVVVVGGILLLRRRDVP